MSYFGQDINYSDTMITIRDLQPEPGTQTWFQILIMSTQFPAFII